MNSKSCDFGRGSSFFGMFLIHLSFYGNIKNRDPPRIDASCRRSLSIRKKRRRTSCRRGYVVSQFELRRLYAHGRCLVPMVKTRAVGMTSLGYFVCENETDPLPRVCRI